MNEPLTLSGLLQVFTVAEIQAATGASEETIRNWRDGIGFPHATLLIKLAPIVEDRTGTTIGQLGSIVRRQKDERAARRRANR